MTDESTSKLLWHWRAGLEWAESVLELFPALWDAAKTFAPLVVDFCPTCHKPVTVLWVPVGDHDQCDELDPPSTQTATDGDHEPLPPF
jgi:hypothetical protein